MSEPRNLLHQGELVTRWGDMDALGHVNNAVYFTYFEQMRVDWLAALGTSGALTGGADSGPVVVTAACRFLRPLVHPARIRVSMYGGPAGRSSFATSYEIRDAGNSECLYTTGEAQVVWVSRSTGRATELPQAVRGRLPER